MRLARTFLGIVVFVGALLGGAAFLERASPWPDRQQLEIKRELFAAEKDAFDLVFFGSSRVLRDFVPDAFDRECADRGLAVRSFNFGVGGMHELETDHVIRSVLAMRPARLRYVLVEWRRPLPFRLVPEDRLSDRSVFWHTPRQWLATCRQLAASRAPWDRKVAQAWHHLVPTLAHVLGYGRAREPLVRRFTDEPAERIRSRRAFEASRGYEPVIRAEDAAAAGAHRAAALAPAEWAKTIDRIVGANAQQREATDLGHLHSLAAAVRTAGARLVIVVPPGEEGTPEVYRLAEHDRLPAPLLGFNRPDDFPALYAAEHRYSAKYLSAAGALVFSGALAERFVTVAAAR